MCFWQRKRCRRAKSRGTRQKVLLLRGEKKFRRKILKKINLGLVSNARKERSCCFLSYTFVMSECKANQAGCVQNKIKQLLIETKQFGPAQNLNNYINKTNVEFHLYCGKVICIIFTFVKHCAKSSLPTPLFGSRCALLEFRDLRSSFTTNQNIEAKTSLALFLMSTTNDCTAHSTSAEGSKCQATEESGQVSAKSGRQGFNP